MWDKVQKNRTAASDLRQKAAKRFQDEAGKLEHTPPAREDLLRVVQ